MATTRESISGTTVMGSIWSRSKPWQQMDSLPVQQSCPAWPLWGHPNSCNSLPERRVSWKSLMWYQFTTGLELSEQNPGCPHPLLTTGSQGTHGRTALSEAWRVFPKQLILKHFYTSRIPSKHLGKLFFNTHKFVLACSYGKFNHMCKYNNMKKKKDVWSFYWHSSRFLSQLQILP